jgi:uncharacterized protein HemX
MKRLAAFMLLAVLSLGSAVPTVAQQTSVKDYERQSRKAAKQQQKTLKKSLKKQQKATKKYQKEQQKATQKANKELRKRRAH